MLNLFKKAQNRKNSQKRSLLAQNNKPMAAYTFLLLSVLVFSFGFSSAENPLIGKWKCQSDKTMEEMNTSNMSEMEKQFYARYFKNIHLEVTENEMISEQGGSTDRTKYEVKNKKNNKIEVYYPEEDENDTFTFLDKDTFKWSTKIKQEKMVLFFEKQ